MKRMSKLTSVFGLVVLLMVAASPAKAAFVVGGESGWQMSFDGMINAFMVYSTISNRSVAAFQRTSNPNYFANATSPMSAGFQAGNSATQSYRIRTGLLPSIFGFNVKSPTIDGVTYAARLGLYPQIQNNGQRTGFGPDTALGGGTTIDIREVYFTADGKFGQFLIGRALNLYQGQNILTDITLMGVGVTSPNSLGGTTLGRIGYGYLFPAFGSQFRYTTPDMNGFKFALSVNDPSKIVSDLDAPSTMSVGGGLITRANLAAFFGAPVGNGLYQSQTATVINQPAFMMEMSYAKAFPNGKINTWVSALYQEAKNRVTEHKVSTIGGAGGIDIGIGPVGIILSGYGGQALGLGLTIQDLDALDFFGKERVGYGGLAQVTYDFGKWKIGAQYGINYQDQTDGDHQVTRYDQTRPANFGQIKKSQQAITGMATFKVNKYLSLVGEYTWAKDSWYDSTDQTKHIGSVGTIFTW
jgi:hypothetical protein